MYSLTETPAARARRDKQQSRAIALMEQERRERETTMKVADYWTLCKVYGTEKAEKAVRWFVANHSPAFRASVHAAAFCQR
jgi:hypothetical protein